MALLLTQYPRSGNSGNTESPFVLQVNNTWYLSICTAAADYMRTSVFKSNDDKGFSFNNTEVFNLTAHAAEWI